MRKQKNHRNHKTFFHLWCLCICNGIFIHGSILLLCAIFEARTIVRIFNSKNYFFGRSISFNAHRICKKTHGAAFNASHSIYCLFDTSPASRANLFCNIKLLFITSHIKYNDFRKNSK